MGLFDMFGAGGGSVSIQPVSPHVTAGQALVGNVVFMGGKRAQQINALTIRLTQETRTMQMTNQGPQPRTDSRDIVPATPLTQPFQSTPERPANLPFQLQVPAGLPNSVAQQVSYHLRVTADIPGEVDPGASLEIQVVGGMQPQMGMPGQMPGQMMGGMPGQMPGQMMGGMPGQMPGQMMGGMPGQMPGQMGQMPGQMANMAMGAMGAMAGMAGMPGQPGMMQPGMPMQPGMMQPGMPMQAGMPMQGGMPMGGQMQIAPGTRVNAQWHGDGQLHHATVRGFDNGMYQVDWQEPHLGGNAYVYPQQIQILTGGPGMPGQMPAGKGVDPYAKGAQPDPYGKGAQPDPYGKGGGHDMHGKGAQPDPYGKGGGHDMHGKGGGHDMHGKSAPQGGGAVAMGAHVVAQHPNGTWYPGRVAAMQNGMIGVDWDDAKLGASSWVQPHQVRQG